MSGRADGSRSSYLDTAPYLTPVCGINNDGRLHKQCRPASPKRLNAILVPPLLWMIEF